MEKHTDQLIDRLDSLIDKHDQGKKDSGEKVNHEVNHEVNDEVNDEVNQGDTEIVDVDDYLDQKVDNGLNLGQKILGSDQKEEIESEESSEGGEHEPKTEFLETDGDDEQKSIQHPPELTRGWKDWFTEHPNKAKQTYGEHLVDSWKFGLTSLATGIFFLIHGLFPFMFEFTGSDWVIKLARHLEKKRKLVGLDRKLD